MAKSETVGCGSRESGRVMKQAKAADKEGKQMEVLRGGGACVCVCVLAVGGLHLAESVCVCILHPRSGLRSGPREA